MTSVHRWLVPVALVVLSGLAVAATAATLEACPTRRDVWTCEAYQPVTDASQAAFRLVDTLDATLPTTEQVARETSHEAVSRADDLCLGHDDAGRGQDAGNGARALPAGLGTLIRGDLGRCLPDRAEERSDPVPTHRRMFDSSDSYRLPVQAERVLHLTFSTTDPQTRCVISMPTPGRRVACGTGELLDEPETYRDLVVRLRTVVPERDGDVVVRVWDCTCLVPATGATPQTYTIHARQGGAAGTDAAPIPAPPTAPDDGSSLTTAARRAAERVGASGPDARLDAAGSGNAPVLDAPDGIVWLATAGTLLVAGWILHRRLSPDRVLSNDVRCRILERVAESPGVTPSRLAEEIGVALQTILYHVRVLRDHDHLVVRRVGGTLRLIDPEARASTVGRETLLQRRHRTKGALIDLLARDDGLNISEAARRLDRHRSTVKRHVDDLVELGVVEARRDGTSRVLSLADEARDAVRS